MVAPEGHFLIQILKFFITFNVKQVRYCKLGNPCENLIFANWMSCQFKVLANIKLPKLLRML